MDLWDLTKLLFRRWLISVPILLLSVVLLLVASQTVKPDYKATGHLIIVSPAQTAQALNNASPNKVHNPWEDLGFRALAQTAILKVQSADMLKQLVDQGYSDNLTLAVDDRTPVITIEVVAHSALTASATIREVIKNLDDAVTQAQTVYGVQRDSLFTAYPIDQGDSVETVTSTQKRAMAVIAGIGLVGTVAVTIIVDALAAPPVRPQGGQEGGRRRGRRAAGHASLAAQRRPRSRRDRRRGHGAATEARQEAGRRRGADVDAQRAGHPAAGRYAGLRRRHGAQRQQRDRRQPRPDRGLQAEQRSRQGQGGRPPRSSRPAIRRTRQRSTPPSCSR